MSKQLKIIFTVFHKPISLRRGNLILIQDYISTRQGDVMLKLGDFCQRIQSYRYKLIMAKACLSLSYRVIFIISGIFMFRVSLDT